MVYKLVEHLVCILLAFVYNLTEQLREKLQHKLLPKPTIFTNRSHGFFEELIVDYVRILPNLLETF